MNKTQKVIFAAISTAVILCAITTVIASFKISKTPLYIIRMEQVSSKMNFLPTTMSGFIYTAENGYTLNYNVFEGYCGASSFNVPAGTCYDTCPYTCPNYCTYPLTCPRTCQALTNCLPCEETYGDTCPFTCGTCYITCPHTCL